MKIMIVDTYYDAFLKHAQNQIVNGAPDYENTLERVLRLRFGTSDYYSRNLRAIGHDAEDIIYNCTHLQTLWAEGNPEKGALHIERQRSHGHPLVAPTGDDLVLAAVRQVLHAKPDVLYLQDLTVFQPSTLAYLRDHVKLLVGQIASPLPPKEYLRHFDLILTSFPHFVGDLRAQGISSEYFRIGFDPIVLDELGRVERYRPCTFIGGISGVHGARTRFLNELAAKTDIDIFGYGAESLPLDSTIRAKHKGEAWALDMYRAISESRITVNFHIDVAGSYANNMRLYEATGCGALLITDAKQNLHELFKPEVEVVTFRTAAEAVEKINYYTTHPVEADLIARAGQRRTLTEHTYAQRMRELAAILQYYLRRSRLTRVLQQPASIDASTDQSAAHRLRDTWKDDGIPSQQWEIAGSQLEGYKRGERIAVFDALVDVLQAGVGETKAKSLLEVGCSSGYYAEVLEARDIGVDYEGCDYSPSFIERAMALFPKHRFKVADATALPYGDRSFDIVVSGGCLLHIADYATAIEECARVARSFVVFHRTPVLMSTGPKYFTKHAYGVEMFEQHFNEQDFLNQLAARGLDVIETRTIEEHWSPEESDAFAVRTYLCRKQPLTAAWQMPSSAVEYAIMQPVTNDCEVRHYCTLFDRNYLLKGLALHRSLVRHEKSFVLHILCMDDTVYDCLRRVQLANVRLIRYSEFETSEIAAVKKTRSVAEFCWTCTPAFVTYVLDTNPKIGLITYLDSDLYFYSSPDPIYDEFGDRSILIIGHKFSPGLRHLSIYGRYNVGWISFRRDADGQAALDWWRSRCLEWCYARVEGELCGDQGYLNRFPDLFRGVCDLTHKGANVAPWNFAGYRISGGGDTIGIDGEPLIFYHFHGFNIWADGTFNPLGEAYRTEAQLPAVIYFPYQEEILQSLAIVRAVDPTFAFGMEPLPPQPLGGNVVEEFTSTTPVEKVTKPDLAPADLGSFHHPLAPAWYRRAARAVIPKPLRTRLARLIAPLLR